MIDYREELDFKCSLIIFLVNNFSVNANDRKLLTLEKLKLLFVICLTPKKLNSVSKSLNKLPISNYKNIFYDDSSDRLEYSDITDASLIVSYLCSRSYVEIFNEDSKFVMLGERSVYFSDAIGKNMPDYLVNNIKLIKSIVLKSEKQITKALMEA